MPDTGKHPASIVSPHTKRRKDRQQKAPHRTLCSLIIWISATTCYQPPRSAPPGVTPGYSSDRWFRLRHFIHFKLGITGWAKMNKTVPFHRLINTRLKQRYSLFLIATWACIHGNLRTIHSNLLRINQRTRFSLVKFITFRLAFKVFVLCNFCFEKCHFLITKANYIAERKTFSLKSN
ncbi:hypothetical protein MKleb_3853 [Klebsiella sp. PL-2018]|nr:hypothetical protein MKleb_3853 [Klebsiella sp. PL-2018]